MNPDYASLKKTLGELLQKKQEDKANEDALRTAKNDSDRNKILENISEDLSKSLQPFFSDLAKNSKLSAEDIRQALKEAVQVNMPEVRMPEIKIPAFKIPTPKVTVNVPKADAPVVNVPAPVVNFPSEMSLKKGNKPFPVIMMDEGGKPMRFSEGGAGGGRGDFFTISDIRGSTFSLIDQTEGALRVVGSFTASVGSTFAQLANSDGVISSANPLQIAGSLSTTPGATFYASDAVGSVNLVQTLGSATVVGAGYQDNALRVVNATDAVTSVSVTSITSPINQGEGASALRVIQAGDTVSSVFIVGPIAQGDAATAMRVVIAGNSDASVVVNSGTITTVTTLTGITNTVASSLVDSSGVQYSGSNPLPITGNITTTAGATGQGDGASASRIIQAGDTVSSINILQINGTAPATGLNETNSGVFRVVLMTDSVASVNIVSGSSSGATGQGDAASATRVVIAGNSDASVVVNSGTITTVTTLTGITNSVAAANIDSSGVQYSGSNPMPITTVGGGPDSMFVLIAHTANPTAVADGADVRRMADKLGRQVMRPMQVRDLIATAYVSLATGTETTLLAGVASTFLDLINVIGTNNSDAAVSVDLRDATGAGIITTLRIPANGTVGTNNTVPIPANTLATAWTADLPDITGTTVTLSALFSKEI